MVTNDVDNEQLALEWGKEHARKCQLASARK